MRQEEEQKGRSNGWLYGIVAGACVAAMQIGVGLLQMEREQAVLLGMAQGLLVCSLTIICGSMMEWLLAPVSTEEQEEDRPLHPARLRVQEYTAAFRRLARSFAGMSEGQSLWEKPAAGEAVVDIPGGITAVSTDSRRGRMTRCATALPKRLL